MADLIDTNVLVYRFDPADPVKQRIARDLLRQGIADGTARVAHQALVEFLAAVTRGRSGGPILELTDAIREAEDLMLQTDVLYPTGEVLRTAHRGAVTYRLSWFDAHMWAYAEHYGLQRIVSEDFQHDRIYGTVRAHDPFRQP